VYMHDGAIVHDEQTALGEIAATARKVMYTLPVKTEEDDLAGVSSLMKHIPGAKTSAQKAAAKKTKTAKKSAKTKKRASGKAKK